MVDVTRSLAELFWDYPGEKLSLENDRDLFIERILASGTWEQVLWLRTRIGDQSLADWIVARQGRGLDARRLRFWQTVLDIPGRLVNTWLARPEQRIWNERTRKC